MSKRFVKVGDKSIFVVETIPSTPSTQPTIVLVPGLGGLSIQWCAVQRLLPAHLRTISYDRLGLGQSDRTTLPRPATILADEMKATLVASGAPGPYLLVASSYAGIICREFLEKNDPDVAGLVYVDANQEKSHVTRQWPLDVFGRMVTKAFSTDDASGLGEAHGCTPSEWEQIQASEARSRKEREAATAPTTGEWTHYESSLLNLGEYKQLDRQALGNRPFSVIGANLARDFQRLFDHGKASGLGSAEDHEIADAFCARLPDVELKMNSDVLRLSSVHRLIVTSIAGHMVMLWEPELCVQEILWCLDHMPKVASTSK